MPKTGFSPWDKEHHIEASEKAKQLRALIARRLGLKEVTEKDVEYWLQQYQYFHRDKL